MRSFFARRPTLNGRHPPAVPPGLRVYAIGDIHGRIDLLDQLLLQIEEDNAQRPAAKVRLIFLGDLVDRGPDSRAVVDRVMKLYRENQNVSVLAGNHEEVMLLALREDVHAMQQFIRIGGRRTLLSYGITQQQIDQADYAQLRVMIHRLIPLAHIEFLNALEDLIEIGDYAFVHAGVRPGIKLEKQSVKDLRWIRSGFLDYSGHFGKIIIHGHTVTLEVDERQNRIGIDTGASETGKLTAIGLDGISRWYLST